MKRTDEQGSNGRGSCGGERRITQVLFHARAKKDSVSSSVVLSGTESSALDESCADPRTILGPLGPVWATLAAHEGEGEGGRWCNHTQERVLTRCATAGGEGGGQDHRRSRSRCATRASPHAKETAERTEGHTVGMRRGRGGRGARQPPPQDRRCPSRHSPPHVAGSRAPPGSAAASISASTRPPATLGSTRST